MTAQRITTDRELAELRSSVAREQKHAAKLRNRSTRPSVEGIEERMRNAPQRTPVYPEDGGAPLSPEYIAESAKALHALLSGTPDPATKALGEQFESCWQEAEFAVEAFYEKWPELRWFDLLAGADDRLRKPADAAAAAFELTTLPGTPAVVATCKLDEPWVMYSRFELNQAIAAISTVIHCDLQISGPTVIGRKRYRRCVDWFASIRDDELIGRSFVTLPVARGDLIVLVRVCCWCLGAFLAKNAVNPAECVVDEPYSDGFGAVRWNGSNQPTRETDCETDADDKSTDDDGDDDFTEVEP